MAAQYREGGGGQEQSEPEAQKIAADACADIFLIVFVARRRIGVVTFVLLGRVAHAMAPIR